MERIEKIHLLSQELIPIVNDIEPEAKQVVMDHVAGCETCQELYANAHKLDEDFPTKNKQQTEIKPLKKLVQFNRGIKLLLILVRLAILSYIIYSGTNFFDMAPPSSGFPFIQASILMFYLPAAVFLLVFTFIFLSKKWLYSSLCADLFIIFFLNKLLELIIF